MFDDPTADVVSKERMFDDPSIDRRPWRSIPRPSAAEVGVRSFVEEFLKDKTRGFGPERVF